MKYLRNALFAAVAAALLSAAFTAQAAGPNATVSWTPPITYVGGAPLAATALTGYTVTACPSTSPATAGPPCLTFTTPAVPAGTAPATSLVVPLVCADYNITVSAQIGAVSSAASSPPVPYATGVTCTPNPPTGVTVTAAP